MNEKFKKVKRFLKTHKWQSITATAVVALVLIGTVGIAGAQQQKVNNSQKALELAAQDGGISEEQLAELEENGGFAEFGTEIIDPNTGETVVLTQNEDGTIQRTVTKDANGNATGAVVPEDHSAEYRASNGGSSSGNESSSGGSSSGSESSGGESSEHSHNWQPHYATKTVTVQTGTKYVVDTPASPAEGHWVSHMHCNVCGAVVDNCYDTHPCKGGAFGTYNTTEYVITKEATAETGHYEAVYETRTEQYVDYYFCECGATK